MGEFHFFHGTGACAQQSDAAAYAPIALRHSGILRFDVANVVYSHATTPCIANGNVGFIQLIGKYPGIAMSYQVILQESFGLEGGNTIEM